MQLTANATVTNTWASIQHVDFDGGSFDEGSVQVVYTDGTTGAKTFASGAIEVDRITFATKGGTTNGDYFVMHDYTGGSWAIGLDTLGTGAATPTGAAWVAVPSAHKSYVDISSATSGTDVELLVATAINLLTGFTALVTTADSTTHLDCTQNWAGVVTTPAVYSRAGAAGTGSITFSITTAGTLAGVSPTANTVTSTAHGQVTGSKVLMSTSSALPTGLTTTNYWLIVVDANTLAFASSLANSAAGTKIALTSAGVGTQTLTPVALSTTGAVTKMQVSNDGTNFTDVTSATVTITAAGSTWWIAGVQSSGARLRPKTLRVLFTPTTGTVVLSVVTCFYRDK